MSIEQRVESLEAQNRRLRGAVMALLALVVPVLLMGAIEPNLKEVVRAKRFEVIGGENLDRVLVSMGPSASGDGSLIAYNPEGRPLIDVAVEQTDLDRAELERLLDPAKLTEGGIQG